MDTVLNKAPSSALGDGRFDMAFQSIARFFGRPASPTVLFSGIPFDPAAIELEDVERLGNRIGLEVAEIPAKKVSSGEFEPPMLVEMDDGQFIAILENIRGARYSCSKTSETAPEEIDLEALKQRGVKRAFGFSTIYVNSAERAEVGGAASIENRHWLFGTMRAFWRGYVHVALAAAFINIIALASPLFIKNVYDRVLPNKATSTLIVLASGVILALFFSLLLNRARAAIIDHTGRNAEQKISYILFDKVLHSSLAARPRSTGEYANRISQFEFVREFFTSNTIATIIDGLFIFIFLFVIYLIAGWLFVIPLVAFVVTLIIGLVAQYRIGKLVTRAANEAAQRQSLLVEAISTIETVKILRAEKPILRKWTELTKNASRTSEQIKQLSSAAANITQFVQQIVSVVIIIAGSYEFAAGNVSTGEIIAVVMLASRAIAPLSQIAMTLARLRQALLSLKILNGIMKQPEDRPNTVGFVNREIKSGDFAFQDVAFAYPGTDYPVLRGINLNVKAGERVGIIGRIGSGKTTLGRLLGGLYTTEIGRVLIDGIDIRQYHPAEIRSAVSIVGQSVDLFSGTLKENIQLGRPDANDEEIIDAAKRSGVEEFATQHPAGYDMPIGERGENLSGGQRQSVAIARLLLMKPKIVFLDEPSGSMDLASERQLIKNLRNAFKNDVTLVISTHRYSLLEIVDRLVVLERGMVVADGPKDQVLSALAARAKAATEAGANA